MMNKNIATGLALSLFLLSACPRQTPLVESPPPFATATPGASPVLSEPVPTPMPRITPTPLPALEVLELPNGDLVSDSFKLEFGPGSKGVKLEFGPGTKGPTSEFGPGTKGPQNLTFNLDFPEQLANPGLMPFKVQQSAILGGFLSSLTLEIVRNNELYATATAQPLRSSFKIPARFHPGTYTISALAQTASGPLRVSWNQFTVLPEFDAELKVAVFAQNTTRPEDLDIEILSRNRIPRN